LSHRALKLAILVVLVVTLTGLAYATWPQKQVHRIGSSWITQPSASIVYTSEDGEWQFSVPVDFKDFSAPPQVGDRVEGHWTRRK
jgi:hypothetical protein